MATDLFSNVPLVLQSKALIASKDVAATVAQFGHVQLRNSPASGRRLIVTRIRTHTPLAGTLQLFRNANPLTNIDNVRTQNKLLRAPFTTGSEISWRTASSAIGTIVDTQNVIANQPFQWEFERWPLILEEMAAIGVLSAFSNVLLRVSFEWFEVD